MMRQLQWSQVGASRAMAHSKLSKAYDAPLIVTTKALSYSFPQVSHFGMA
jgi:hypothetical protein